jgi:hypothetical protein
MKPTNKHLDIESLIDSITPNPLGRKGSIENNVCAWCKNPATEFRDELSVREYTISGFCQKCQDDTYGI